MNKMEAVLKRLEAATKDANTSLDEIPPGMRPGWSMRIAAGIQDQVDLAREYKALLNEAITKKILIVGEQEDVTAFILQLGELGIDGLAADASNLYRRIADTVAGSMGMRGEFSLHQFSLMNSSVGDVAVENPELEIKDAACEFVPAIQSYDALLKHVRACFRATNGDKVNVALMNKRIVKQALTLELTEPTVLFIRGAVQEELADISIAVVGGPAALVNVPHAPTLEWTRATVATLGLTAPSEVPESAEATADAAPEKKPRAPRGAKKQAAQAADSTPTPEEQT